MRTAPTQPRSLRGWRSNRAGALTDQILAFMGQRPPVARLYRRAELEVLGATPQVDPALVTLAEAGRGGSPAPGLWFPLEPYAARRPAVPGPAPSRC